MKEKLLHYLRLSRTKEVRSFIIKSWSVSWPMILIMGLEFLISLTDVYIAGRIGKEVQATVGLVYQLYFIFIVIANSMTVGTVSVISRLFTSGGRDDMGRAVFSIIASTCVAGLLLSMLGINLSPYLIRSLGIPGELKEIGVPLLKIYSCGLLFHYFLINSNGILRASKSVKKSLATMAAVCACNIALNFTFLYHTDLGYRGIALATALSVTIGAVLNFRHMRYYLSAIPGTFRKRFEWPVVKRVIGIGWPTGLMQISWQMAGTAVFLILSALPANKVEILAAFTNGIRIESSIFLPAFALNLSNAVIIGNLLGEKRKEDAFRNGIVTGLIGVALITALTAAVILNAGWISGVLSRNDIVVAESVRYLYISMLSEPFMAWAVIMAGALNGAGDTKAVMLIVAFSLWLVRIPLCYLLAVTWGLGAPAVWWSMNASIAVQAALVSRRYFRRKWLEYA